MTASSVNVAALISVLIFTVTLFVPPLCTNADPSKTRLMVLFKIIPNPFLDGSSDIDIDAQHCVLRDGGEAGRVLSGAIMIVPLVIQRWCSDNRIIDTHTMSIDS